MAIKLGSNPKSFKKTVSVINVDGAAETIDVTYIYRTRRDFARLIDERLAAIKAAETDAPTGDKPAPVADVSIEANYLKSTKQAAESVLQIATGWDLTDAFNVENLQQLEDQFPGALNEIQGAYQKAVAEVRVKN